MFSDLKVGSRANKSEPQLKIRQSDIPVKHDIPHSHDLPLGHDDKYPLPVCSILQSRPTVTTNANVPIQDSSHQYLPFMGELCCKYCHVSPYDKNSMGNKELPCDHIWERTHRTHNSGMPQTKDALQSLPQLHTSLIMRIVILRIPSPYILMIVLMMTLNLRIPYMSLHSPPVLIKTSPELVTVIPLMKWHPMMMTLFPTCVT